MKTLLFIGFEFHRKTGSADFILQLLNEQFDVSVCWVDLFNEKPYSTLKTIAGYYDTLVCWQVMPPRKLLNENFTWKHSALFPMYDGCPSRKKIDRWYPYRDFQIVCFSKLLHKQLVATGFSAKYIQFFPKPSKISTWGKLDSAFLWARRNEINCNLAEYLLSYPRLKAIHIHNSPDPGTKSISPIDTTQIKFTYSKWFAQKKNLTEKIEESAFYFAPRQKEGIGHSFLEAMAMGRCVIANNNATMNEYIEHGKTGLLYDLKHPKPFEEIDVRKIQHSSLQYIKDGYSQWSKQKFEIIRWLSVPVKISKRRNFLYMLIRMLRNPIKTLKSLIN